MDRQKRVAAIHDISGFGKCSLTVILPIISAAGLEACALPTAVLSTHTGGLPGYTHRDLTDDIMPIANHWKSLGITFDAIYSGYVGSLEQLDIISRVFDVLRSDNTLVAVDPVMGDNGKLYKKITPDFPSNMRQLVKKADIVIPNITEAALLLEQPYKDGPYDDEYIRGLLHGLSNLGPSKVVLTGVYYDNFKLGAAIYDRTTDEYSFASSPKIEGHFHGTGDIFASVLIASYLKGQPLPAAAQTAVDFTVSAIERTRKSGTDTRYGVNFEAGLAEFSSLFRSQA